MSETDAEYSFKFDAAKNTWVCSVHGEVSWTGWVTCWTGCDEGFFDEYEDDPITCEPGDYSSCPECKGNGGWQVCGECCKDNPDVEW